jgi:hypothetical protein
MKPGGNPSAEEMEEALESGAQQVNNVVHSFRLSQTSFDKKVRTTGRQAALYLSVTPSNLTSSPT